MRLPAKDRDSVWQVLKNNERVVAKFHALWTGQAGARKFISLHVLVPGDWTVRPGHQLLETDRKRRPACVTGLDYLHAS
jgi:hypothetical protein